ncbi:hypothetical protein [Allosphingosinicella vermicomposti]|uniref:hypothetical protein n=1 Tax=Allosphingosinicella vermicomposti TaxID=614671 RepID=UPI00131A57D9|nr:hypothetical protein [Allosphingosinicella vermicomposti]
MKKLAQVQKIRIIKINAKRMRKRLRRPSAAYNAGHTAEAKAQFQGLRAKLPETRIEHERHPGTFSFLPPKVFSFSENYEETFAFILDFRRYFSQRGKQLCDDGIRRRAYAEFAEIEKIGPGAGLVLAAETHRFAQTRGKPARIEDHLWAENVRDYFLEAGLFELLSLDPGTIATRPSQDAQRSTLKFTFGRTSHGRDAKALIANLQALAGHSVGPRPAVYAAIAEALANVSHAYPTWFRTWPYRTSRQWWASGFWSPSSNTVGVQLYDQGAGIPATLPKQTHWPRILRSLDPEGSPSGLIAAAMEYGRTSTGQAGRGKGLAEMANWIESTGSGFLRIMSGGGEVTYRPGGLISRRNFNAPFCGTLVQWEVSVGS